MADQLSPPPTDSSPPPALPARPPQDSPDVDQPPRERESVVDPRVVALRSMFPDYDDLILQSVLQSANGNQDRAIDILLGMSDPDYKPEHPPQQPVQPNPIMTQEQLDEQFARQLLLQEQQAQEAQWVNSHGPGVYQPRQGRYQQWSPAQQQQAQGDRPVGEFQEQFNKIAESGKKTFGNLFSKVKAKIQEFETGRPAGQASSSQQQWTPPMQQQQQPQYWQPQPHPPPQQQPAYYDPNPNPDLSASVSPARTPLSTGSTGNREVVQGYDVSSSPPSTPPPSSTRPTVQQLQPQPSPVPAPIPSPSPAQPIDAGKLGLLPKRPVSLLRADGSSPSTSPPRAQSTLGTGAQPHSMHSYDDDDDDGLEYAENPFEESAGAKK